MHCNPFYSTTFTTLHTHDSTACTHYTFPLYSTALYSLHFTTTTPLHFIAQYRAFQRTLPALHAISLYCMVQCYALHCISLHYTVRSSALHGAVFCKTSPALHSTPFYFTVECSTQYFISTSLHSTSLHGGVLYPVLY